MRSKVRPLDATRARTKVRCTVNFSAVQDATEILL